MLSRWTLCAVLAVIGPLAPAIAHADQLSSTLSMVYKTRSWTSTSGSKIEAALVGFPSRNQVRLVRSQGAPLTVPLAQLSPADRTYARRIWNIEHPTVVFGRDGIQLLSALFALEGASIQSEHHVRDLAEIFNPKRERGDWVVTRIEKSLTDHPKAEVAFMPRFNDYVFANPKRHAWIRDGVEAFIATCGDRAPATVLIEPLVNPAGVTYQEAGSPRKVSVPPEELLQARAKLLAELATLPGTTIAPLATTLERVTAEVPAWQIRNTDPVATKFRRYDFELLEYATIYSALTRTPPPLVKVHQHLTDGSAIPLAHRSFDPTAFKKLDRETVQKIEGVIHKAVAEANTNTW